jgi:CO/xanthine dehydrogenase FAD-binding subunit
LTNKLIKKAATMVRNNIKPITDIRASARYRKEAAKGMAMEALKIAWTKEQKR